MAPLLPLCFSGYFFLLRADQTYGILGHTTWEFEFHMFIFAINGIGKFPDIIIKVETEQLDKIVFD